MNKKELDRIFRDDPEPGEDERPSFWWVIAVLFILAAMMISISSCAQVTAGFETAKSRSQFGVGFTTIGGNWYGPLTFTWLAEPKRETVIEGEQPFTELSKPSK
jgi:hypothetical protein